MAMEAAAVPAKTFALDFFGPENAWTTRRSR